MSERLTIGRKEWVRFPDLGIQSPLLAKIDTGAMSSSLHVDYVEIFDKEGKEWLRVAIEGGAVRELRMLHDAVVKSSNGEREHRYFIRTQVEFANGRSEATILSLTDRSAMKHPVLLGRRLLKGKFVVDVAGSFLFGEFR